MPKESEDVSTVLNRGRREKLVTLQAEFSRLEIFAIFSNFAKKTRKILTF